MTSLAIRKYALYVEELHFELNESVAPPRRKVISAAVVKNPLAGRFSQALAPLPGHGEQLGRDLCARALAIFDNRLDRVHSYGKAAIVGLAGELEHAAAILHPRFGKSVRAALPGAKSIMPSAAKRAAAGATMDIPLHGVADEWSFDHFDAAVLSVEDAPDADEILVALALADGGRPLARIRKEQ